MPPPYDTSHQPSSKNSPSMTHAMPVHVSAPPQNNVVSVHTAHASPSSFAYTSHHGAALARSEVNATRTTAMMAVLRRRERKSRMVHFQCGDVGTPRQVLRPIAPQKATRCGLCQEFLCAGRRANVHYESCPRRRG